MPKFTVIANTKPSVLYLAYYKEQDARLVFELFTGNPETTEIIGLHVASADFKQRIHLLDTLGESFYEPKKFFNDIPINHHFIILSGHIKDVFIIQKLLVKLSEIDGISIESSVRSLVASGIGDHYEIRVFKGDSRSRISIGVKDKTKRVCRFCGKSMQSTPKVEFSNKSHAISESLGNKGLICLEECEDCNKRFGKTIEQDITNLFSFQLIMKGVKGKKGDRTIKGDGVSITNDTSSREVIGRDTITISLDSTLDTRDIHKITQDLSKSMSFPQVKYRPQNIYKCFCKYVLSLIDSQYLQYFQETIKWINEPLTKHELPPIWHYVVSTEVVPSIAIMIRKHNGIEMPYCWAIISIAGLQFLYILPFCSLDNYMFLYENQVKYFMDGVKNILPNVDLKPLCFDGIEPVAIETVFNLDIPSTCVEGKDYYFVESNSKQ